MLAPVLASHVSDVQDVPTRNALSVFSVSPIVLNSVASPPGVCNPLLAVLLRVCCEVLALYAWNAGSAVVLRLSALEYASLKVVRLLLVEAPIASPRLLTKCAGNLSFRARGILDRSLV